MSLESAYLKISELVNDFKNNEKHYLSSVYSEAQARIDFIDKFFIALGWDVNHDVQKNPYEQEVVVEKNTDNHKRADYMYALAPKFREPKFFVEAKKPLRALKNVDDYFQALKYGWNAQNPFVILTDFEEFHILDSRYKPDPKSVFEKCYKKFHYTDYLDKEKFSEIYYLFSRESVEDNSIEKRASELPKPRGKAVQRGLFAYTNQSIDESFLDLLDKIRLHLARSLKKNNIYLDGELLTETTQRIIDRLVFIRFLEDKEIEAERHISAYGDKGNSWKDFVNDSKEFNAKYNGIVFREHNIIDSPEFKGPDENDFSDICEELSHLNSPFDFRYIPINILGSIYERFLGKVIHATEKRVTIEKKPEVRKAGGVYYTPQYIVDYIVDNTVGKQIEDKTPVEISKMSFADISCGSGSFLITVFDKLLQYHSIYYQERPKEAKKAGCYEKDGKWILSLKQKKEILLNNIYGVDIDSQACEVTQLSLFLKLLEDESLATAQEFDAMFKERILPDLGKNIICGNSLIGTDIYSQSLFDTSEEEKKINAMDFENAFPEVMKKGGFDGIVGNPPWIDIKGLDPIHVDYYFKKYSSSHNRINIYAIFLEKSLRLLNEKSLVGFIIPNSILYQSSYEKLRNIILKEFGIQNIVRLPDDTFINVKAESVIFIISRSTIIETDCIIFDRKDKIVDILKDADNTKLIYAGDWINNKFLVFDIFTDVETKNLLNNIESKKIKLEEICDFTLGLTPYDKYKGHSQKQIKGRVFHSTQMKDDTYKKLLQGSDVTRYYSEWGGKEYISYGNWLGAPREKRFFTKERILIRQIVSGNPLRIYASYTNEELYNTQTIFNLVLKDDIKIDLKFILAILNSKLMNFYHSFKYLDLSKNLFQKILIQNCKLFPIPKIDFKNVNESELHFKIVKEVFQIMESKKQLTNSQTDKDKTYWERRCNSIDREIDKLVYELYGLTEEEIELVESKKN
ncbi:MAG TPA: N-6 DNA methylase [Ignavibacteria bacterium]|nr:N-6 DNA methylase [Ignavibacteria bacterium]HMR41728.1 N-6 DNA methylase [Ignavibacteria bacterium]